MFDPSVNIFAPYSLGLLQPLVATGCLRTTLEDHVRREVEKDIGDLEDRSRAEQFARACPVRGAAVSDYLPQTLSAGPDLHVLAGLRFKGGDLAQPFIEVARRSRPLRGSEDIDALRTTLRRLYRPFAPLCFRVFLSRDEEALIPEEVRGSADLRLVAGRVQHLTASPLPPSPSIQIRLVRATTLAQYPTLLRVYEHFYQRAPPAVRESVQPASRPELEECLSQGTLFDVQVGGDWAGMIGVRRTLMYGIPGFEMSEVVLDRPYRRRGLAVWAQRRLLDRLPADHDDCLIGTILRENVPSLKTALRVGRSDLGGHWFIRLDES